MKVLTCLCEVHFIFYCPVDRDLKLSSVQRDDICRVHVNIPCRLNIFLKGLYFVLTHGLSYLDVG